MRSALVASEGKVFEGGSPMSGHITRMVAQSFGNAAKPPMKLTSRSPKNRASARHRAPYIQRIYEKLHVHSLTEAVMKYARRRDGR